MIKLTCPSDKNLLIRESSSYRCSYCNKSYPIVDSVVKFLQQDDEFYEGAYKNTINYIPKKENWPYILPLWVVSNGYVWFTRKFVPKGSTVLELGCASGVKYFAKIYEMIGLDLSFNSLKNISDMYDHCIQVNASEIIPLPDHSVDAIISSYFWEHLLIEDKEKVLKEAYRVLKPGGTIVFLFDVETTNPLINRVKIKFPEFYKKSFLERDGHLGYHSPKENQLLFSNNGFCILKTFGMEKTFFQSPSVYLKLSMLPSSIRFSFKPLSKLTLLTLKPYLAFLRFLDTAFKRILPENWARIYLIIARK